MRHHYNSSLLGAERAVDRYKREEQIRLCKMSLCDANGTLVIMKQCVLKGLGMEKIKLLQFPIANSMGGITHYALENWKWMDKNLFSCDFATMSKHLDFEEEILASGSKIFYISCYAEDDKEQFIKEFDEILNNGYDIVHLHTKQWKSFLVEELCKKHQVKKVIVHSHSAGIDIDDPYRRNKEERLHEQVKQKFNSSMATDFWACSRLAAEFLFGGQIPIEKIKIMPNAINLEQFEFCQETRDNYRERYGLTEEFVIGHVGRFSYSKNHEFMINVFAEVLQKENKARLVLLGDGELVPRIQEQIKMQHITEKVLFMGKREDIRFWYQAIDTLCLPSRFEGFPLTLIEAQAAGLPCITSDAVTEEVAITEAVVRLPLSIDEWVEQILAQRNRGRIDGIKQLTEAGYSLRDQIRVVEREYAEMPKNEYTEN